ncbi:sugar MFS transporter [Porphyrobacter sp. ULC335]|uniref:sugar MFS transporter n=1 Tax=Porphyrobacter sp. ULC335 TaxID=2854260 RepID=UPI002220DC9B|nr:sugar MFS transporter [Porphyrobacter sp. ULC335]
MAQNGRTSLAFAAVTTLFFAWGFITSMLDPLVASVKGIFTLSDFEAQLSAFAFFIAYGVISLPAAVLLTRLSAVPTIKIALAMMIAGCLTMLFAANVALYPLVLVGLFILASGITVLQVAANPLAAALGAPERSHFRLTLSQTFNSVGTFIGPIIGASLFLKDLEVKPGTVVTEAVRATALAGIDLAYFWIAGMIAVLLLFFHLSRRVVAMAAPPADGAMAGRGIRATLADALSSRWAVLGGLAIFLYVGAEVAIGTQMALFLNSDQVWGQSEAAWSFPVIAWLFGNDGVPGISLEEAGKFTAIYWGAAMVGRAVGSVLLARVKAAWLLAIFTVLAALMCLYIMMIGGTSAGFVALAIGLFNSIMFPVIFTLTLERSTAGQEATSGLLCTAIVGGAFIPLVSGAVSGATSYAVSFIVPALCYAALTGFAIAAGRTSPKRHVDAQAGGH